MIIILFSFVPPDCFTFFSSSELTKAVEPHVKQEDEGKYRCKTCSKLFKAPSFVEKHMVNRHQDLVKSLEDVGFR